MKFCYFDESGMGEEPYLVVAGIIVDPVVAQKVAK
jgi:hypothetical protein